MGKIHLGFGNKQLVNQKGKIKFIIFDIPNKNFANEEICIQRTPLCDRYCYVTKCNEERTNSTYEAYNDYRKRNYELSKSEKFVQDMVNEIKCEIKKLNDGEKIYFRIHSSGEFYSYDYFKKWVDIAEEYKNENKISFIAYTKSFDILEKYFKEYGKKPNININISIMYDTFDTYFNNFEWDTNRKMASNKDQINRLVLNYNAKLYCAVPNWMENKMQNNGYIHCKLSQINSETNRNYNCGQCMMCYSSNPIKIYTELRRCSLLNYGKKLEENDLELAIKWYKDCIVNGNDLNQKYHAYKRLNILYKKNNRIRDQKEVLEEAIRVCGNINDKDKGYLTNQLRKINLKDE